MIDFWRRAWSDGFPSAVRYISLDVFGVDPRDRYLIRHALPFDGGPTVPFSSFTDWFDNIYWPTRVEIDLDDPPDESGVVDPWR